VRRIFSVVVRSSGDDLPPAGELIDVGEVLHQNILENRHEHDHERHDAGVAPAEALRYE